MDKALLFVDFLLVLLVLDAVDARLTSPIDEPIDDDEEDIRKYLYILLCIVLKKKFKQFNFYLFRLVLFFVFN